MLSWSNETPVVTPFVTPESPAASSTSRTGSPALRFLVLELISKLHRTIRPLVLILARLELDCNRSSEQGHESTEGLNRLRVSFPKL